MKERFEQQEKPAGDGDVLSVERFLRDFRGEIKRAKDRIVVQTMALENDATGRELLDILREAPKNVRKEVYADWWSKLTARGRMLKIDAAIPGMRAYAERLTRLQEGLFKRFERSGVALKFTNPPKNIVESYFPFLGRNHIKGVDVDGSVFYLGGFNFCDDNRSRADFMVKFTGSRARTLSKAFGDLHQGRITEDAVIPLDDRSSLYIDSGKRGESIILETARRAIEDATEYVEYVSMLPPDGGIAAAFRAAQKRDVHTEVIMSRLPRENPPLSTEQVMQLVRTVSHVRKFMSGDTSTVWEIPTRGVHAKLLIVDAKLAYFGSHNLSESGVKAGTQEWGIFTSDPVLVRRLRDQYFNFRAEADARCKDADNTAHD